MEFDVTNGSKLTNQSKRLYTLLIQSENTRQSKPGGMILTRTVIDLTPGEFNTEN